MTQFEMVCEFLRAFGKECPEAPAPMSEDASSLWTALDAEETAEYYDARAGGNMSEIAKELADRIYILFGHAATLGLTQFDEIFAAVHRSNMSKLGADGKPVYRPDGKVMKGPGYQPPAIDCFLTAARKVVP